jgi:hypothetical protein
LLFVFTRFGFNQRLFVVLVFLSAFFVSLTFFTGRQPAHTLILELQYASEALGDKDADPPNAPNPPLRREAGVRAQQAKAEG